MTSKTFWQAAGVRAVKTFAQALITALTLASPAVDVLAVNWAGALSLALGSALLSVLTTLASLDPPAPGKHAAP